jgi:hypothetical protein
LITSLITETVNTEHSTWNIPRPGVNALRDFSLDVRGWMLVVGCFFALLIPSNSFAQTPLSNLVFTVGTSASNNWSYVLVNATTPSLLAGKRFAVYGKPGYPTNAGAFTLRGNIFQQTDTTAINTLLNQSVALGQDLNALNNSFARVVGTNIIGLLHNVPGIVGQTLPQRVLTAFQFASTDPTAANSLALLANGNPGLQICAGHAFAEQISGTTTYEVREINPGSGAADYVVGRVTINPGVPVILFAPGQPFQVMTNLPSDHLLIRMRWGTPPELRRLSVLQFGYNIWRIPKAAAEAGNFHITPPTPAQLNGNTNFTRANSTAAIFTTKDFTTGSGAGAADDPADRTTYFFADNGRATLHTNFNAGDQFYYFVTARDLLGRDGLVSPGRLMTACRRLLPTTPEDVRVENAVLPSSTNQPRLQVIWTQNTNATDAVDQYWIYRWVNPTGALTNDAVPLSNRVGVVAQLANTNLNSFTDNTPGARTNANPTNVWYTVRAVSTVACDPLLSPQSSPAWGVLRERGAPDATTGEVVGSCGTPVVMFQRFATNSVTNDLSSWHVLLTCQRRDPGIAWVMFVFSNALTGFQTNGPIYFSPGIDMAQTEFLVPAPYSPSPPIWTSCTVGTLYDQVSQPAVINLSGPIPSGQQKEIVFLAGQLLASALSSSDPLYSALNGSSICYPANNVKSDASGMVSMTFNAAFGSSLFIQALVSNVWNDVGIVTPDSNNVYWVSYPACLVGPVPNFRGCTVNLPNDSGCDQHVTAAADGSPSAPLRIRFRLTPRTQEFRIYRRADDGPMTFFAQGPAVYNPSNPTKTLEARDEAMPSVSARLCYFVQLLDEHGNGSPLAFIGCKETKPPKPPRPVLAEPKPMGSITNPQVMLNWFCPTAGVSRFSIKIKQLDAPTNGVSPRFLSVYAKSYTNFNRKASYLGLASHLSAAFGKLSAIVFDGAFLTTPISEGFGPGPQFTLTADVSPNVNYLITVAAVDDQGKILDGATSEAWPFIWTAPIQPANVPWPARPLPPVGDFDDNLNPADYTPFYPRVRAVLLTDANFQADPRYPVGVSIGYLEPFNGTYQSNVRSTDYAYYNIPINTFGPTWGVDPNDFVFRRSSGDPSRKGNLLLPIVVYRQQIANTNFPKVSGDITQVSPMIESVPWTTGAFCTDCSPHRVNVIILDRLMAIAWKFDQLTYHQHVMLCVRDQQPVQMGATYRYYVVRFNAKREVQEIIQAGDVDVPFQ